MSAFGLWAAIRTIKERVGTWVGYERYRAAGLDMDRATWATYVGQARAALANRVNELTRPLNRRPTMDEVTVYTSRRATGFAQQLDVFVRDRDTGLIEARPYTVRGRTLLSRQSVINIGVGRYQAAVSEDPEEYPEEVIGAAYVGTYEFRPEG